MLPVHNPVGCVWLSQNAPLILLSCFSAVIDSCCTDGLLPLLGGEGSSQKVQCSGRTWGVR